MPLKSTPSSCAKARQQVSENGALFVHDYPQALRQHLGHVCGSVHEAIVLTDPHGVIRSWPPGAERIFGYAAEEIIGRGEEVLLPPHLLESGELEQIARRLEEDGEISAMRTMRIGRDGKPLAVSLACALLREAGRVVGRSQVYRDLTEAANMNRQMRQSQRLVTVAQLVAGLAHEIGTPLNVVAGRAELLSLDLPADDPRQEDLRVIMRESDRAAELIRTLLQFARGSNQVRQRRCSMNEVVQDVLRLMAPQLRVANVEAETALMKRLPLVTANRNQLLEVVLNLVFNAMQAMPRGGTLAMETSVRDEGGVQWVELRVRDTGTGITEEHGEKIFAPFFSTKPLGKGTGLGLTVVANIIQQHGGKIDFTSAMDQGTTFMVTLPAAKGK